MKYEKCVMSVSYFVVCFAKTFVKYPQNVKYEKCTASVTVSSRVMKTNEVLQVTKMVLSLEQCAFIVKWYYETYSLECVYNDFIQKFPDFVISI